MLQALAARHAVELPPLQPDRAARRRGLVEERRAVGLVEAGGLGRADHGAILREIAEVVDAGALTPVLDEARFGMEQAGDAYDHLASGEAIGKVVIDI